MRWGQKKNHLQETALLAERNPFPKIIVRRNIRKRWYDDHSVLNIGIFDFLPDDSVICG